jgi:hypothetical protein
LRSANRVPAVFAAPGSRLALVAIASVCLLLAACSGPPEHPGATPESREQSEAARPLSFPTLAAPAALDWRACGGFECAARCW